MTPTEHVNCGVISYCCSSYKIKRACKYHSISHKTQKFKFVRIYFAMAYNLSDIYRGLWQFLQISAKL